MTCDLGVAVGDLNNDGWPDVYVSNDLPGKDHLYMNNRDGSFTQHIDESIKPDSEKRKRQLTGKDCSRHGLASARRAKDQQSAVQRQAGDLVFVLVEHRLVVVGSDCEARGVFTERIDDSNLLRAEISRRHAKE